MPIILTVLGFLWWWPIGLVLLGLFLGRGKFGCRRSLSYAGDAPMFNGDRGRDRWERKMSACRTKWKWCARRRTSSGAAATGSARDERQPRLRRLSLRDAEAPRRGAERVQGFPCPAALRQGSLRVRSVHGRTARRPRGAEFARRAARSTARLTFANLEGLQRGADFGWALRFSSISANKRERDIATNILQSTIKCRFDFVSLRKSTAEIRNRLHATIATASLDEPRASA